LFTKEGTISFCGVLEGSAYMCVRVQTLYCPTNAHNIKNIELLKQSKVKEAAPTCFSLQGNHHQGAT